MKNQTITTIIAIILLFTIGTTAYAAMTTTPMNMETMHTGMMQTEMKEMHEQCMEMQERTHQT